MNRCISITKNNKRCRAKTNNLFCCKSHEPFNKDIIEDGCFLCIEKIEKSNELLFFHCKHAFHKKCYIEWLNYSTYDEQICIICRRNIKKENIILSIERKKNDISKLIYIKNILESYTI